MVGHHCVHTRTDKLTLQFSLFPSMAKIFAKSMKVYRLNKDWLHKLP